MRFKMETTPGIKQPSNQKRIIRQSLISFLLLLMAFGAALFIDAPSGASNQVIITEFSDFQCPRADFDAQRQRVRPFSILETLTKKEESIHETLRSDHPGSGTGFRVRKQRTIFVQQHAIAGGHAINAGKR